MGLGSGPFRMLGEGARKGVPPSCVPAAKYLGLLVAWVVSRWPAAACRARMFGSDRGREGRVGRMPLKGWLMLMLGASRAPLSAEEAQALRKPKNNGNGKGEPQTTTVVVPPPRQPASHEPGPTDRDPR